MSEIKRDGWPDRFGGKTRTLREHIVAPEPQTQHRGPDTGDAPELPPEPEASRRGGKKRDR